MTKKRAFLAVAFMLCVGIAGTVEAGGVKRKITPGKTGQTGATGPTGITGGTFPSTYTIRFGYGGSVLLSTNTVCPFPKACFWTGNSTLNVVDIQAAVTFGSTVAMTSFQIVESSGGVPKIPAQLSPAISRFPRLDVSTATADKLTSYSPVITTGVVIPAYTWVGVQSTTAPISGRMPEGFEILMNVWKKPYGGL